MSYAIIRNEKYTKEQMIQLAPHNERFKKKYSNKNILYVYLLSKLPFKKASRKWILKRI